MTFARTFRTVLAMLLLIGSIGSASAGALACLADVSGPGSQWGIDAEPDPEADTTAGHACCADQEVQRDCCESGDGSCHCQHGGASAAILLAASGTLVPARDSLRASPTRLLSISPSKLLRPPRAA